MPNGHVLLTFIEYKVGVVLIDSIVGEVHADILHVLLRGNYIGFGCETSEPFVVEINSQRVDTSQQHIDSKVKLQPLDEVGFMEVALHYIMFAWQYILDTAGEEDPFPLRQRFRLHNISPAFTLGLALEVEPKLAVFTRQHPSQREEVVLLWKLLFHLHQALPQEVLSREYIHACARRLVYLENG